MALSDDIWEMVRFNELMRHLFVINLAGEFDCHVITTFVRELNVQKQNESCQDHAHQNHHYGNSRSATCFNVKKQLQKDDN